MTAYLFNLYSLILLITTGISLAVCRALWRYRKLNGVLWLILLELSAAQWAFFIMIESAATTVALKQFWAAVAFIGTCLVPPFFFMFAAEYDLSLGRISRKLVLGLLIMPVFTIVMSFTNPLHYLLWTKIEITPGSNVAVYSHGPTWWFIYIYEYILILPALYFLLKTAFKSGSFYIPHSLALIIGAILPITGNLVYVFGPNPIPGLDWAPVGFALSGVVLAWGILRFKMFKLTPVAHTLLVENMIDGMIVLDEDHQVVDINPAAAALLRDTPKNIIGQRIEQLLPSSAPIVRIVTADTFLQEELDLGEIQPGRKFELRLSTLQDRFSRTIGKSLVLRDITEKKRYEEERERMIAELREALKQVKTLSGLLPICANCKNIRDDQGYWHAVEEYIQQHSNADFSHGICPACIKKYYPEIAARMEARKEREKP